MSGSEAGVAAAAAVKRWVGFDMDECVGSLMPLYTFVTELPEFYKEAKPDAPADEPWNLLIRTIVRSELAGKTWLIRPALISSLNTLYEAWVVGKIQGAFVYSNNGSDRLVRFVASLLNGFVATIHRSRNSRLFQMAVSLKTPCRTRGSLDKTFADIQACLQAHGLPPASSPSDLLFFDDLDHVLTGEITHYVKVRPYTNYTSVYILVELFDYFKPIVGDAEFQTIAIQAARDQMTDMKARDNIYVLEPPTSAERRQDMAMFRDAFERFFQSASRGGGRTRRWRRCRNRRVSKHKIE